MGIYIKGVEMPEDGETVTLTICADGLVFEEFKEPGDVFHAVHVPPHGDLIDRDALVRDNGIKEIPEYYEVVCAAPTILEAEEGET